MNPSTPLRYAQDERGGSQRGKSIAALSIFPYKVGFDRLFTVFPGDSRFPLHERAEAVGLTLACAEGF